MKLKVIHGNRMALVKNTFNAFMNDDRDRLQSGLAELHKINDCKPNLSVAPKHEPLQSGQQVPDQ